MGGFKSWRDTGQHAFAATADKVIGAAGPHSGEIARQTAHIVGNGHVVVVEYHQYIVIQLTSMVKCLKCHAGRHRAIADDGNHLSVLVSMACRHFHAQRRTDRRARMANPEGIVLTFIPAGECGQTTGLPHGQHLFPASGENLVRIRLVPDIPDQSVVRGVKDIV